VSLAEEVAIQLKQLIENSGCENFMRNYHYLMGKVSQKKGNIAQAIDYFEMAFDSLSHQKSTADNHAFYLYALASAERIRGDVYKAQNYYKQMISLTLGKLRWGDLYGLSRYHLGKIYQQRGMKQEAIEQYERFLKLWENADFAEEERGDAEEQLRLLKDSVRE
jgi:tetratricopeptide (TPR) repeat protein